MSTYVMNFSDSFKSPVMVPPYRTEGPANPLNPAPQGGTFSSTSRPSTSLLFVGKGVSDYGLIVQRNLLYLLENFASNGTPPVFPTVGQLWYDNSTRVKKLKLYTGQTPEGGEIWEGIARTTGDEMTGFLTLHALPDEPFHAVPKTYVDNAVLNCLPLSGGTLTGNLILNANPTASLHAATKQYVDSKVAKSGDTMSGFLTLNADPTANLHAATKQYVDSAVAEGISSSGFVLKTGDVMSGSLTLNGDPVNALHAATKQYVDTELARKSDTSHNHDAAYVNVSGDTMTGFLILNADPIINLGAATKQYVDTKVGTDLVQKSGDVMTGALYLYGSPTDPLEAATKSYVDLVAGGGGDGVVVSGFLNASTGTLDLTTSLGGHILISNISPFSHTHNTFNVLMNISGYPGYLNDEFSNDPAYPNISLNSIISSMTEDMALLNSPSFVGLVEFENATVQPTFSLTIEDDATLTIEAGATLNAQPGSSVVLGQDPVLPLEAATKQYVDDVSSSIRRSLVTSTEQSLFTTPPYTIGANNLWVFVNGIKAYEGMSESYTETTTTSVTFTYTVPTGAKVEFLVFGA